MLYGAEGYQVDELTIVRHVTVYVWVREISSPKDPLRGVIGQHPRELYSILKRWLLDRNPVDTTKLDPDVSSVEQSEHGKN